MNVKLEMTIFVIAITNYIKQFPILSIRQNCKWGCKCPQCAHILYLRIVHTNHFIGSRNSHVQKELTTMCSARGSQHL